MKKDSIILIGMAGVGKSTLGLPLSRALGFTFIDLDEYIREKDGKTVQEVIDDGGEVALLQLEKERMYELDLARTVVAPGGSIIYHADLMAYLKQHATIVYLKDSFEDIEARLASATTRGIVGLKNKSLREIYQEREPLYARYADITLDCHRKSYRQMISEIRRCL